jgi:hypothetical protein
MAWSQRFLLVPFDGGDDGRDALQDFASGV